MNVSVKTTSLSSSIFFFEESTFGMFHMVELSFLLTVIWLHLYAFVNAKYCVRPDNSEYASVRFCQSSIVSSSHVYINGSSILTKESLIGKECVCHVVWSGNSSLAVNGFNSCNRCGLDVAFKNVLLASITGGSSEWGTIVLDDKSFPIAMKINTKLTLENIDPEFCLLIQSNGGMEINVTLTCEELNMPTTVSTTKRYGNSSSTKTETTASSELPISFTKELSGTEKSISTQQNSEHHTKTITTITVLPGLTMAKSTSNINEVAAAAGGFGVGVVVVIVIEVIIFVCYKRRMKNKDMQRSSTAPPRDYTELEFNSRVGQNNSHIYKSIERQNTYVNDV